jgi:lysozyme
MRKISEVGVNFIIKEEGGIKTEAYLCQGGVWTIGVGHTGKVKQGDTITEERAKKLFDDDLDYCERAVNKYVKVDINQNMFDSLVSFVFNVGIGAFKESTLLEKINSKDFYGASEEFKRWKFSNGKVLPVLVRRRKRERNLFNGYYF